MTEHDAPNAWDDNPVTPEEVAELESWKHRPWFIFDTETTGVDVEVDRIVQVGGLWMQNGEITGRHLVTVNPGVPIPEGASAVHGIDDHRVAGAPSFAGVFPLVLEHFRRAEVVLTYNGTTFDWPLMVNECRRLGGTAEHDLHEATAETLFVDVLTQVKRKSIGRWWKGRGRHRLAAVGQRMEVVLPPGMRPHRADADCYITGRVLWLTRGKLPNDAVAVRELLADRHAEQRADYENWKGQQGV